MKTFEHRDSKRIAAITIAVVGLLFGTAAVASHDQGPADLDQGDEDTALREDREPRFEDEGESLRAELEVRDVNRNRGLRAELEATAEVEFECRRRGRSFDRQLEIELEGVEHIRRRDIDSSRLELEIETEEAEEALDSRYGPDGGCPEGWRRRIEEVSFLDAKIALEQRDEELTWLCTFDDPTRDGSIRRRDVDCQTLF